MIRYHGKMKTKDKIHKVIKDSRFLLDQSEKCMFYDVSALHAIYNHTFPIQLKGIV